MEYHPNVKPSSIPAVVQQVYEDLAMILTPAQLMTSYQMAFAAVNDGKKVHASYENGWFTIGTGHNNEVVKAQKRTLLSMTETLLTRAGAK